MFGLENSANNFGRSAGLLANTTALRPVEAAEGTIYVDVQTLLIYRYDAINTNSWQEIGGGGGGITGAFNGCQEQSNQIGLGGQLSEATDINTKDFPITFNADAINTPQFSVINDAAISELAYFSSLSPFNDGGVYIGNFETFGTIQSKEYAGQTPTELRLNYDGGSIQLGSNNFGMTFDDGTPKIQTTFGNNLIGLKLDFDTKVYKLGDFDAAYDGTFLTIDDVNTNIETNFSGSPNGLRLNAATWEFNLGDWNGQNNSTFITVLDPTETIEFVSASGFYNFANVPNYANNAAAISGGLNVGDIYRSTTGGGDQLHIVH
jgi:hypothetical protein